MLSGADLQAHEGLCGLQMVWVGVKCTLVSSEGIIVTTSLFVHRAKIDARVGMARHKASRPFKLSSGFVEFPLTEVENPEVVMRWAVIQVCRECLAEEGLGLNWICGDLVCSAGVQFICLAWVARRFGHGCVGICG